MGIGLIAPVLPNLLTRLTGKPVAEIFEEAGMISALYAGMIFLFSPLLGALSDRYGRRPVLLFSLFGQSVDYLIMAFAPALWWIILGRAFSGITGASITTAQAYIADVTAPENRAKAFGLVGAAFGLGFILGPAAGGLLGEYGDRVPFFAAAGLALANGLYGMFVLPESLKPENRRKLDLSGTNPFGALYQLRQFPQVLGLLAAFAMVMLGGQIFPSIWSLYTTYRFDWGPKEIGWSLAFVGFVVGAVQGGLTRVIIPKLGEHTSVRIGITAMVIGLVLYGLSGQSWMMYAFLLPYALGGIATPSLQALMTAQIPPDRQGQFQGIITAIMSLSAFIAPLLYTNVFAWFTNGMLPLHFPGASWWLSAMFMLAGLLLVIRALRRTPKLAHPPQDGTPMAAH